MRMTWMGFSLATIVSFTAHAESLNRYTVDFFPKSEGQTCFDVANHLSNQLKAAGIPIARSSCADDHGDSVDVVLYYSGERLPLVSTVNRIGAFFPETYTSEQACLDATSFENNMFREQTGLQPVLQFCYLRSDYTHKVWGMRIDAFGETNNYPYTGGTILYGSVLNHNRETFTNMILERLSHHGIAVRAVGIRAQSVTNDLIIGYYAAEKMYVEGNALLRFKDDAQCLASLDSINQIVARTATIDAGVYCASDRIMGRYEATLINLGNIGFQLQNSLEAFPDFESCESEREGLLNFYREQNPNTVIDGLCHIPATQRVYRLALFSRR